MSLKYFVRWRLLEKHILSFLCDMECCQFRIFKGKMDRFVGSFSARSSKFNLKEKPSSSCFYVTEIVVSIGFQKCFVSERANQRAPIRELFATSSAGLSVWAARCGWE